MYSSINSEQYFFVELLSFAAFNVNKKDWFMFKRKWFYSFIGAPVALSQSNGGATDLEKC